MEIEFTFKRSTGQIIICYAAVDQHNYLHVNAYTDAGNDSAIIHQDTFSVVEWTEIEHKAIERFKDMEEDEKRADHDE